MTTRISNPFPLFLDRRGFPLDGGKVYIGAAGADPQVTPVTVYLDEAMTIPAPQPLSVIGGLLSHDGNPAHFYVDADSYSIRSRDADGAEISYAATAVVVSTPYQPLDADLTAIAALATSPFGRALLTMASSAALRTYAGIVDALPLTGGTVTGAIVRSGGGAHPYMVDAAFAGSRIFVTANGAADPTSQPGDIWLEKSA